VAGYLAPLPLEQLVEHLKAFLGHLILLREERFIFLRRRGFVGGSTALPCSRRDRSASLLPRRSGKPPLHCLANQITRSACRAAGTGAAVVLRSATWARWRSVRPPWACDVGPAGLRFDRRGRGDFGRGRHPAWEILGNAFGRNDPRDRLAEACDLYLASLDDGGIALGADAVRDGDRIFPCPSESPTMPAQTRPWFVTTTTAFSGFDLAHRQRPPAASPVTAGPELFSRHSNFLFGVGTGAAGSVKSLSVVMFRPLALGDLSSVMGPPQVHPIPSVRRIAPKSNRRPGSSWLSPRSISSSNLPRRTRYLGFAAACLGVKPSSAGSLSSAHVA